VESNWVHSVLRPPTGLLCQTRVITMMENLVEWWLAGETKVLRENLPQCHFVHHKPDMLCPDTNTGCRAEKPATNRLSYGMASHGLMGTSFLWPGCEQRALFEHAAQQFCASDYCSWFTIKYTVDLARWCYTTYSKHCLWLPACHFCSMYNFPLISCSPWM
jgi:hypothetical protein